MSLELEDILSAEWDDDTAETTEGRRHIECMSVLIESRDELVKQNASLMYEPEHEAGPTEGEKE